MPWAISPKSIDVLVPCGHPAKWKQVWTYMDWKWIKLKIGIDTSDRIRKGKTLTAAHVRDQIYATSLLYHHLFASIMCVLFFFVFFFSLFSSFSHFSILLYFFSSMFFSFFSYFIYIAIFCWKYWILGIVINVILFPFVLVMFLFSITWSFSVISVGNFY